MAESDVERAKMLAKLRSEGQIGLDMSPGAPLARWAAEEIDRLARELREAQDYAADIAAGICHYPHEPDLPCARCRAESAEAEVADLRAKLAAAEAEREKQDEWVIGPAEAKIAMMEARLAELQRENERLKECIRLHHGPEPHEHR